MSTVTPMTHEPWQDPDWLAGAHAWIEEQLAGLGLTRTGPIEQPHKPVWSTVMKVPTDVGTVWFKANSEPLRFEAGLVTIIADRRPDAVPPLLASDPDSGWMLMADAGEWLRTVVPREQSLERWRDVLRLYAGVQLDLADEVDRILALGVPDMRLATLPGKYDRLMDEIDAEPRFREASTYVRELADELAAYGLPELLQHDD